MVGIQNSEFLEKAEKRIQSTREANIFLTIMYYELAAFNHLEEILKFKEIYYAYIILTMFYYWKAC